MKTEILQLKCDLIDNKQEGLIFKNNITQIFLNGRWYHNEFGNILAALQIQKTKHKFIHYLDYED